MTCNLPLILLAAFDLVAVVGLGLVAHEAYKFVRLT